jgi:PilM
MWPIVFLAVIASALGLSYTVREQQRPPPPGLASDAIAANMLTFDRAAAVFVSLNPGYAGVINQSQLSGLPSGYKNLGGWQSAIRNNHMMTFSTATTRFSPDIADAMMRYTDGQLLVGRISNSATLPLSPSSCWGFVAPTGGCISAIDHQALISTYAQPGRPIVLRKFL